MSSYNRSQEAALRMVLDYLNTAPPSVTEDLRKAVEPYLAFREAAARFQEEHLSRTCTRKCFHDGTSACCGREGILTFFADTVVNALLSTDSEMDDLLALLARDQGGPNCVYLVEEGCAWSLKPITCEMFLCDHAKKEVLGADDSLRRRWEELRREEKLFTFPDRPVLFDDLEKLFLDAGIESDTMYCHKSPGLILLKRRHGVRKGANGA